MGFLSILISPYMAKNQRFTLVSGHIQTYYDQKKARVLASVPKRTTLSITLLSQCDEEKRIEVLPFGILSTTQVYANHKRLLYSSKWNK